MKNLNDLTDAKIGGAIEVHRVLGPGLLESTYEMCLCRELSIRGLRFQRQVPIAVEYKGAKLDCGYRADLVVDESGGVLVNGLRGRTRTCVLRARPRFGASGRT